MVARRVEVAAAVSVAAAAMTLTGVAQGGRGQEAKQLRAVLGARQEVPKQTVRVAGGNGVFTATLVDVSDTKTRLTWRLTFSHLSGPALAAHIHRGPSGLSGPIVVPLCGPCRSGAHGTTVITVALADVLDGGGAYVNVHTKKNPGGEIRGQLVAPEG